MTHPDREVLIQLALDEPIALDASTLVHIADCPECSAEVESLRRTVAAAERVRDDVEIRELVPPPASVWERIAEEAGLSETTTSTVVGASRPVPVESSRVPDPEPVRHEPPRRRIGPRLAAAAVVGAVIGAAATGVVMSRDDDGGGSGNPANVATSDLTGFDGHTTTGVASLAENKNGGELSIELNLEDVGDGFIQAWLLDEDTGGMVALGVIDGDEGTFAVPSGLDLAAFNQIDISLEPFDGNPEHSAVSLARGPTP